MDHHPPAVWATQPELIPKAAEIARRLAARLVDSPPPPPSPLLVVTPERLELRGTGGGAVYVDFVGGTTGFRMRNLTQQPQPLLRAVRLREKEPAQLRIVDATAGWGRDGFILAAAGYQVTLVERSPVAALLLADGLHRAAPLFPEITARIHGPILADSRDYLRALPAAARPEVIYLDPMYPAHEQRRAPPKKELSRLRLVVGDDPDAGELLATALATTRHKVVLKRPCRHRPLPGPPPSHSLGHAVVCYDIYRPVLYLNTA